MSNSKLKIYLRNNTKVTVSPKLVKRLITKLLSKYKISQEVELGILAVSKEFIKKLNKKHLGIDKSTDVLSFAQIDCPGNKTRNLGDIIICPELARDNIKNTPRMLDQEILFLIEHGFKHLIGIHHNSN